MKSIFPHPMSKGPAALAKAVVVIAATLPFMAELSFALLDEE